MSQGVTTVQLIKSFLNTICNEKGKVVTEAELYEFIDKNRLSDEDLEGLYSKIAKNKIEIIQSSEFDTYAEKTEDELYAEEEYKRRQDDGKILETDFSEFNIIQMYYKDIAQYSLLNQEEEIYLAKQIREYDKVEKEYLSKKYTNQLTSVEEKEYESQLRVLKKDRDLFINSNLRLVINTAKRYLNHGVDLSDLIQEGNMGLLKAVEKYDVDSGFRFSTYATWWIRQRIVKYVRESARAIKIPMHISTINAQCKKAAEKLRAELDRDPTFGEIAEIVGIPEEKVAKYMDATKEIYSLDHTVANGDNETKLGDYIQDDKESHRPESSIENEALANEINNMLRGLNDREKQIIIMRYGLNGTPIRTLEYIGDTLGVTRERVRQIEKKVLRKLRHPSLSKYIVDFIQNN